MPRVIYINENGVVTYDGTDITPGGPVNIMVAGNVETVVLNGMATLNVTGNVTYAVANGPEILYSNPPPPAPIHEYTAYTQRDTSQSTQGTPSYIPRDTVCVGFGQIGQMNLAPGAIAVQHVSAGQIGMDFSKNSHKRQRQP